MDRIRSRIFDEGPVIGHVDPNSILDKGNPASTVGIMSIIGLCDVIERPLLLKDPSQNI